MRDAGSGKIPAEDNLYLDSFAVPEEPFGISKSYWKAGLILFSVLLMAVTILLLVRGETPNVIGALYTVPAILFAYFYRRKGVLIVYLLSMFFFATVIIFRYPSSDDIFAAALRTLLLVAIALTVSYLTHYLVEEKRKYHAIFENTENGVVLLDIRDLRIVEMNKRFALSVGLPEHGKKDCSFTEFIADPARLSGIFSSLRTQCTAPSLEISMRRADGSTWVAVVAARKISADHVVMTFIDFSERKRLEAELHQLHEDANLYLDILTHDINNINTASLNYGRLLQARGGESRTEHAANLLRSLEKSDEIIRNISALRIIREGKIMRIPIQISSIIEREIAGYPGVSIIYDGTGATVLADEMLSSVFSNLIGNAIKFGGKDPQVIIRVEDQPREVRISISDTGPGIPDSLKPHIFERFQRGDNTVSGKGLGLYICKVLIERYGGSIRVEDRVPGDGGKGALFRFTLQKP